MLRPYIAIAPSSKSRTAATSIAPSARRRWRAAKTGPAESPELVEEAPGARRSTTPEIVLTGVHIGTYGLDTSPGVLTPGRRPGVNPPPVRPS